MKPHLPPAPPLDSPPRGQDGTERRASCAECGVRPAQRYSLFCAPCEDALTRSAALFGELAS